MALERFSEAEENEVDEQLDEKEVVDANHHKHPELHVLWLLRGLDVVNHDEEDVKHAQEVLQQLVLGGAHLLAKVTLEF